jgi:hypothetical protein
MAGGLMQLVAYGAQDVYLTGNPKVTFFQAVYKRHTNFAMENIEQTVNGTAGNSGRVSVTIARNGDLISDMYVELSSIATASTTKDADHDGIWAAERAIKDIELSIGGQRIDKHYQKWWRLYAELYMDESAKLNYGKMTSAVADDEKVYLPLIFFFNRNPGLALPLIALQYHEVRIDIDLATTYANFDSLKVWGNYIYLDTEERRRFAQKGHEYLIEQVQHTGTDSLATGGATKQIRLSYNHPVKELVWCTTKAAAMANDDNNLWNFTDTPAIISSNVTVLNVASNVFVNPSSAGAPQLLLDSTVPFDEQTSGPLDSFKLVLNGQDRFKEQGGKYFNQVQPFVHHSASPMPGIYSYSFALKPEEHQPTGTCNFSRIDNAQVSIALKSASAKESLNMFATNYNVLRIQSGMGGLAFSN